MDRHIFNITAQSIAHPLWEGLPHQAENGRVVGIHRRSCNLLCASLPEQSRIITLAEPAGGNGPFAILVDGLGALLEDAAPNLPIQISNQRLTIGHWGIDLSSAELWEPRLPQLTSNSRSTVEVAKIMRPYRTWPLDEQCAPTDHSVNHSVGHGVGHGVGHALRLAADAFLAALAADDAQALTESTKKLAGLGSGLTPSGDDFLVGAMGALWIYQHTEHLALIAQHATEQTTALSATFLLTAAQGQFAEPWHLLLQALHDGDAVGVGQATDEIAQIGASSGRDALAGFSEVYTLFVPTAA